MFRRLGVLILAAMLCLTGCEKTETTANHFPNAPWGASIEEIEKHYALEYRDNSDGADYYTAQAAVSCYDADLIFAFSVENSDSSLYGLIGTIRGLSPDEAMAIYDHEESSLLYDFLNFPQEHDPSKMPYIYHKLSQSENSETYELYFKCNAAEMLNAAIRENTEVSE